MVKRVVKRLADWVVKRVVIWVVRRVVPIGGIKRATREKAAGGASARARATYGAPLELRKAE